MYSKNDYRYYLQSDSLIHYGVKGMKWRKHGEKVNGPEYDSRFGSMTNAARKPVDRSQISNAHDVISPDKPNPRKTPDTTNSRERHGKVFGDKTNRPSYNTTNGLSANIRKPHGSNSGTSRTVRNNASNFASSLTTPNRKPSTSKSPAGRRPEYDPYRNNRRRTRMAFRK